MAKTINDLDKRIQIDLSNFSVNGHTHDYTTYIGDHAETAGTDSANSPYAGMAKATTRGMYLTGTYNDAATPVTYGNIINLAGRGTGQILCEWLSGTNSATGKIFYRSHRDTTDAPWGPWKQIAFTDSNISGSAANAATADKLTTARTLTIGNTGKTFDGSGNQSWTLSEIGALPAAGGSLTGNLHLSTNNSSISGICGGGTDRWNILGGGTDDNGYLEINTRDNGNEPIYVRQYDTSGLVRTATLLDGSGNTSFPGTISERGTALSNKYAASNHGTHVTYSTTTPKANGTAAVGSASNVSRGDHVHPLQESVAKLTNARTITIGNKSNTFNGSANISYTLKDIGAIAGIKIPTARDNATYVKILEASDAGDGNIHAEALLVGEGNYGGVQHSIGLIRISTRGNRLVEYTTLLSNDLGSIELGYVRDGTKTIVYLKRGTYPGGGSIIPLSEVGCSFMTSLTNLTTAPTGYTAGTTRTMALTTSNVASATKLVNAKTLTIGSTGKTFDGSANVSWSLSEIGALPTAGGTMTGDLKFTDVTRTTYPADSKKIIFNGSTDGADIFYRVEAADKGTLVFNLRDDADTSFAFAYAGSIKSRIDTSGNFSGNAATATTATTATKASTVNVARLTGSGNSANYSPGANQLVVREYDANCTNMPSAHWYHIYTGQGTDAAYNTQLAVGMTTEALYFRNKNANTWGSWKKVSVDGHGTHVSYGGNGSATTVSRSDHSHSFISIKGNDTITSTTDDTTAKWGAQGVSTHFYTKTGQLIDQPSQWGYILNIGQNSEVHQLWMTQASGDMLHRGGNGSGWSGTWRCILDGSNFKTHVTPSAIGASPDYQDRAMIDINTSGFSSSGTKTADTYASLGNCYQFVSTSTATKLAAGNFNNVKFGKYALCLRVRTSNNTTTSNILTVTVKHGSTTILTKSIKGTDFSSTSNYCNIYTSFDFDGTSSAKGTLSFQLNTTTVTGITLKFDYAYITLMHPSVFI